jgi:hypothetical protein
VTITEESRDRLYQRLKEAVGETEATTLMEHLPPVGWADVATKTDVDYVRTATKSDLDHLREVMNLRFTAVESEMDRRFTEVARRFDEQDAKFATKADIADLRTELHKTLRAHTFTIIGAMVAVHGAMAAFLG